MKKFLVLVLGTVFVLGLASVVYAADVEFSGNAYVRGNIVGDTSSVTTNPAFYDQRIRLKAAAKVDDVEVRTRFTVSEGDWGMNATGGNVTTDHAYLHFPLNTPMGTITVDVGRQPVNFGTKFVTWDAIRDRIKLSTKIEGGKVGLWIDKNTENLDDFAGSLDTDTFGVFGVKSIGDMKVGARIWHTMNKTGATDVSTTVINPLVTAKAGSLNIATEAVVMTGDSLDDAAGNAHTRKGLFASVSMPMEPLTVSGAVAYANDGFTASAYFMPTVFFGTEQATAIGNFGADNDETAIAAVIGADYKVSDALSTGLKGAYCILGEDAAGDAQNAIEVDLGLKYSITADLSYTASLGYLIPNDAYGDDNAIAVSHKLEIEF